MTTQGNDLYMTVDEYLSILKKAMEKINSSISVAQDRHHPEDISIAVEVANECLYAGLSELIKIRHNIKYVDG